MSTPFTTANATNWLSPKVLSEIITAYNEIDSAFTNGYFQLDPTDYYGQRLDNVDHKLWRRLQLTLEKATSCVNHVSGPLLADKTAIREFTMPEFLSAAGLPADGLRRARSWNGYGTPVWETGGYTQAGDIIGPWIIEDLQKAFSAMRWTARYTNTEGSYLGDQLLLSGSTLWQGQYQGYDSPGYGYPEAVTARNNWYNTEMAAWDGSWATLNEYYRVNAHYNFIFHPYPTGYWYRCVASWMFMERARSKVGIANLSTALPHRADLYLKLITNGDSFADLDEIGWTENEYNLCESFTSYITATRWQTNYLGDSTTNPGTLAGFSADMNEQTGGPGTSPIPYYGEVEDNDIWGGTSNSGSGCKVSDPIWVIKWDYTYQNII